MWEKWSGFDNSPYQMGGMAQSPNLPSSSAQGFDSPVDPGYAQMKQDDATAFFEQQLAADQQHE